MSNLWQNKNKIQSKCNCNLKKRLRTGNMFTQEYYVDFDKKNEKSQFLYSILGIALFKTEAFFV